MTLNLSTSFEIDIQFELAGNKLRNLQYNFELHPIFLTTLKFPPNKMDNVKIFNHLFLSNIKRPFQRLM